MYSSYSKANNKMGGLPQSMSVPKLLGNEFFGAHSNPSLPVPAAALALAMSSGGNNNNNGATTSSATGAKSSLQTNFDESSTPTQTNRPKLQTQTSVSSNEVKQRLKNVILQKLNRAGNSIASLPSATSGGGASCSTPSVLANNPAIKSADPMSKHPYGSPGTSHFFPPHHSFVASPFEQHQQHKSSHPTAAAAAHHPGPLNHHHPHLSHLHHHHQHQHSHLINHHNHLLMNSSNGVKPPSSNVAALTAASMLMQAAAAQQQQHQQQQDSEAATTPSALNAQLQRAIEEEQSLRRTTSEPNLKVTQFFRSLIRHFESF